MKEKNHDHCSRLDSSGRNHCFSPGWHYRYFQDKIRALFYHLDLRVSVGIDPPDCLKTVMVFQQTVYGADGHIVLGPQNADSYYIRLRVMNKGNVKANLVEVFAEELPKRQADGTYRVVPSFLPMNLGWSHTHDLFFPAISPGIYKHCDLFHVVDPKKRKDVPMENTPLPGIQPDKTILSFDTFVKPYTLNYLIPAGSYHLKIIIASSNTKPIKKTLEILLTGEWYDDERQMLGEGVAIQIL